MSGKVVKTVVIPHQCDPGWRWEPITAGAGLLPFARGGYYGKPPTPSQYPAGTVWECECGKTWVSKGAIAVNAPGICGWKREARWAERRRIKRESR